jgi:uncharacterized protein YaaQ
MKLLICVINRQDTYPLNEALMQAGHRATMISSTGGFLREGNATFLIGVAPEELQSVLDIIQTTCHTRTRLITPMFPLTECAEFYALQPMEVEVGGAVVFILNVESFARF